MEQGDGFYSPMSPDEDSDVGMSEWAALAAEEAEAASRGAEAIPSIEEAVVASSRSSSSSVSLPHVAAAGVANIILQRRGRGRPRKRPLCPPPQLAIVAAHSRAKLQKPGPVTLPDLPRETVDAALGSFVRYVPNALGAHMLDLHKMCLQEGTLLNDRVDKLGKVLFESSKYRVVSDAARGNEVGLSSKHVKTLTILLVATGIVLERALRAGIENVISNCPTWRRLHYVEAESYDETPMAAKTRNDINLSEQADFACLLNLTHGECSDPAPLTESGGLGQSILPVSIAKFVGVSKQQSGPIKIFQIVSRWGALLSVELHGAKKYFIVDSENTNALSAMDRVTGETTRQALRHSWGVSVWSREFEQKTRSSCSDSGAANPKGERGIQQEDRFDWQHANFFCGIHHQAGASKNTFAQHEHVFSGILNCALSVQMGGAWQSFLRFFSASAMAKMRFTLGPISKEAEEHRFRCIRLFCCTGRNLVNRFLALKMFPNGDWRLTDVIEIIVEALPATPSQELRLKKWVVAGLQVALLPKKWSRWSRHRWDGRDLAVDQIARLECCHGLFSSTYPQWSRAFGSKRSSKIQQPSCGFNNTQAEKDIVLQ